MSREDRRIWLKELFRIYFGNANLDGEFNTADLTRVLEAGKYETQQHADWSEGDWNGDGILGTVDLVFALQDGGYEMGPRRDAAAVPEPSAWVMVMLGLIATIRIRRR